MDVLLILGCHAPIHIVSNKIESLYVVPIYDNDSSCGFLGVLFQLSPPSDCCQILSEGERKAKLPFSELADLSITGLEEGFCTLVAGPVTCLYLQRVVL